MRGVSRLRPRAPRPAGPLGITEVPVGFTENGPTLAKVRPESERALRVRNRIGKSIAPEQHNSHPVMSV